MMHLTLYGEVGDADGINVTEVVRELRATTEPVTLHINSIGGDLLAGLALYNFLTSRTGITAVIEGAAASIASIVMLGASRVLMPENAWIMLHPVSAKLDGDADQFRDTAVLLDKTQAQLVDIYAKETGQSPEVVQSWMQGGERWFDAQGALAAGLIDEIIPAVRIRNSLNLSRFASVPAEVRDALTLTAQNQPMKAILTTLVQRGLLDCSCMTQAAPNESALNSELEGNLGKLTAERDRLQAQLAEVSAKLEALSAESTATLKARAEQAVDAAIAAGRLEARLKLVMLNAYIADEKETVKTLAELPTKSGGTSPVLRSQAGGAAKSLKDQIEAEADPVKRNTLRNVNWDALVAAG